MSLLRHDEFRRRTTGAAIDPGRVSIYHYIHRIEQEARHQQAKNTHKKLNNHPFSPP